MVPRQLLVEIQTANIVERKCEELPAQATEVGLNVNAASLSFVTFELCLVHVEPHARDDSDNLGLAVKF